MIVTQDECVNCGLPCIGDRCRYRNVTRFYCDDCGEEFDPDDLYILDDNHLCTKCLAARFDTVADKYDLI